MLLMREWEDEPATMTGREIHHGPATKFEKNTRKWDPIPMLIEPNTMQNPPTIRSNSTWYRWGLLPKQQFLWSSVRSASSATASWIFVMKSLESMSTSNSTAARCVVSVGVMLTTLSSRTWSFSWAEVMGAIIPRTEISFDSNTKAQVGPKWQTFSGPQDQRNAEFIAVKAVLYTLMMMTIICSIHAYMCTFICIIRLSGFQLQTEFGRASGRFWEFARFSCDRSMLSKMKNCFHTFYPTQWMHIHKG